MNASFTPHAVDPGWWYRWPRDAAALLGRYPLGFLLVALAVVGLAFIPQNVVVSAPVSILLGAMILSLARSADHHAGAHLWTLLRSSMRDAARLAWNVFVYVLIFTVILGLLHTASHGLFSAQASSSPYPHPAWSRIPAWLRTAFITAQNDQLVSVTPWLIFMVYIALSLGHPGYFLLSSQSVSGMLKNMTPSVAFALLGLSPELLQPLVRHLGTRDGVFWSVVGVSLLNVTILVLGYLFAREVFEGQKQNVPVPLRITITSSSNAGQRIRVPAR